MKNRIAEILASAVVVSVVGYAIWPLGDVPWRWVTRLPESVSGDLEVVVVVLVVTGLVGFGITRGTRIRLSDLAVGGVLAYGFWMAVLLAVISFHEPLLPVISYGLVLVGVLLGAIIGETTGRGSNVENHTRSS